MKPLNNHDIKDVLHSLGIIGDVYGSVIQQGNNNSSVIVVVINIGHTTYGDNSHIEGDIAVNKVDTNNGIVGVQGDDNTVVAGNDNIVDNTVSGGGINGKLSTR